MELNEEGDSLDDQSTSGWLKSPSMHIDLQIKTTLRFSCLRITKTVIFVFQSGGGRCQLRPIVSDSGP